ncbi:LacI family DNA-binding transcriptional regulator [Paenibacillus glucanolyticus]|uniref:LacI family DNA-binding transcriptional regulator n=1 Tax=Paenibacillus glucanolyticus TaxID=59843 RepID=UPI00096D2080|nr:LacI family DNA-binding transcriptional regulator [Paenibacillus glucanolyticus]OMF83448.1 LacI family transcriptional regulator [Paenibacillus glucanolyticus]
MIIIASRKEVAQLAGVSEATVSRVLNGVGPIKEETRLRVLEVADRLGYTPSALARSFARRRSGNLGVVMPYLPKARIFSAYYFSEILSGIGSKALESKYDLLMLFREPGGSMDYMNLFRTQKVDACIILGARDDGGERQAIQQLSEGNHPYCLINQYFEGEAFHVMDADHVDGSYQAVRHLTEQGFQKIAFLNGPSQYSNSRDRLQGYAQALNEAGIALDESLLFEGNFSRKSGYAAAELIARQLDRIEAVFAANDRMAIGLQQGLRALGISEERMPAFVGYDDSEAAELCTPPLTSVRVPFYELGCLAAAHVLHRLDASESEDESEMNAVLHRQLSTRLVIRASSLHRN